MAENFERLQAELARIREENADIVDNGMADPAENDASELAAEEPSIEGMTLEERMAVLSASVVKQPLCREPMYECLRFCQEEKPLKEIEDHLAALPAFERCPMTQYYLIRALERSGGLEFIERDDDGEQVTPERKEGLTEDEIDDLVATWNWQTTEAGVALVERQDPRLRLARLLDLKPERLSGYRDVLAFLTEPRTYDDVKKLMTGRPELKTIIDGREETMQPSVFLDKLERAGAIAYRDGWILTEVGKEYLEEQGEQ